MVKMTKAQAKRRLLEAQAKFQKVYTSHQQSWGQAAAVQTADMAAVEKIVSRCLKRLG